MVKGKVRLQLLYYNSFVIVAKLLYFCLFVRQSVALDFLYLYLRYDDKIFGEDFFDEHPSFEC